MKNLLAEFYRRLRYAALLSLLNPWTECSEGVYRRPHNHNRRLRYVCHGILLSLLYLLVNWVVRLGGVYRRPHSRIISNLIEYIEPKPLDIPWPMLVLIQSLQKQKILQSSNLESMRLVQLWWKYPLASRLHAHKISAHRFECDPKWLNRRYLPSQF